MSTNPSLDEAPESLDTMQVLADELAALRQEMLLAPSMSQQRLDEVHPNYRDSACNLLHYLALRRHDLRPLQLQLATLGLSSLGRAESHVMATVDSVLGVLGRLTNSENRIAPQEPSLLDFSRGERLLADHTNSLLGEATQGRDVRIMVTMPSEAAHDYLLIQSLLEQGMDCMRINCAHDNPESWLRMIEHLKRAQSALGRSCKVVMDLAGPKLRTGPIEPGPAVVHIRPSRDQFGKIAQPARVWLTRETRPGAPPSPASATLPVPDHWLEGLGIGDVIHLADSREVHRTLKVVDITESGLWAEAMKSAYVVPSTRLRYRDQFGKEREAGLSNLPRVEQAISLQIGDSLIVTRDQKPGRSATFDSSGHILTPATIGCSIPEVFDDVRPGESIWFDDGKIGGVVDKVDETCVHVRITWARIRGEKLRSDKGINLPESNLQLDAMTEKDIEDLAFVSQHADVVELSFANTAKDVEALQEHLQRMGMRQPAIVLKIETRRGFENLPDMLLTAMRSPSCGVMIARGDLAVECGFERLAEVQEEMLWICEAAHVPVIWATQVLETLAKEGIPSRAEITDAAMGHRAECVMLNKGPHMVSAVRVLDDIMRRMQAHQAKKRSMLRELRLAHTLQDR